MMILDPKSTFSEEIQKFLQMRKFMKILKNWKSQGKWPLFQFIFEIHFSFSKKFLNFTFEILNKSRNTYKTNEKPTFFQNESFFGKFEKHKRNDVLIIIGKFIESTRALVLFHKRNTENEPKWKSQDKCDHLQNRKVFKNTRVFIDFEIRKEHLIELSSRARGKWENFCTKKN